MKSRVREASVSSTVLLVMCLYYYITADFECFRKFPSQLVLICAILKRIHLKSNEMSFALQSVVPSLYTITCI